MVVAAVTARTPAARAGLRPGDRILTINGAPLRDVIELSPAERLQLRQDAAGCDGWRAATWLLHELDGAPLPRTAYNRAKRIACDRQAD